MNSIISCVDGLLFASKINATAKALGVVVKTVVEKDIHEAVKKAVEHKPRCIILDLNSRKLNTIEFITALKSNALTHNIPIVGFFSHIQTDLYNQAIEAGCDQTLPRSQFVQNLDKILVP